MKGWISIHRKIEENELWLAEPFTKGQAWVDLLLLANHTPKIIWKRGIEIQIKRGEVGWSEDRLAKRWQWSRGKVRRFLKYLKTVQQIEHQNNHTLSRIIIQNYDKYQLNGTTDGTTDGTNNNNGNNDNKKTMETIDYDTGENITPKKPTKGKNKQIIDLAHLFEKRGEEVTGVKPDLTKAYFKIAGAMKRNNLSVEDVENLFSYFFADGKLGVEKKTNLGLCVSGSYITQWQAATKNKQYSAADISSEIKL